MTTAGRFIGIDVAKRQVDVSERPSGVQWATANTAAGLTGLVERLQAGGAIALIVVEATGGYATAVVAALTAAGLPVVVVNARQVRDFARAVGPRPTPSTRESWRTLPKRCGRRCAHCPMS